MTTARRLHYRYDQYLAALEVSGVKLEYCDGEIYAMSGATSAHADLAAAMVRCLGNAVLGRCRVSTSDLKVRVEATDLSTFPDVTVVGHTDTTGDRAANFQLGLDRAMRVRRLLVEAGLDASLIEVISHGETDLLVPTPDETSEPRNRRVEIAVR